MLLCFMRCMNSILIQKDTKLEIGDGMLNWMWLVAMCVGPFRLLKLFSIFYSKNTSHMCGWNSIITSNLCGNGDQRRMKYL